MVDSQLTRSVQLYNFCHAAAFEGALQRDRGAGAPPLCVLCMGNIIAASPHPLPQELMKIRACRGENLKKVLIQVIYLAEIVLLLMHTTATPEGIPERTGTL